MTGARISKQQRKAIKTTRRVARIDPQEAAKALRSIKISNNR